jgi:hypothetical protein
MSLISVVMWSKLGKYINDSGVLTLRQYIFKQLLELIILINISKATRLRFSIYTLLALGTGVINHIPIAIFF